jgi:cell division septal protein FtsQ
MRPRRGRINPNTMVLLKQIGIGVVVISVVALLLTGLWHGTRLPALTLSQIEASGGETIEHTVVEGVVQEILNGSYLNFIPFRFAWLYPEQEIVNRVSSLERIYNVQVTREGGTALHITYDEYLPHALWCQSANEDVCIFLSDQGYAFASAPQLSGGSFLRFVTAGREAAIGEVLLEKFVYDAVQEVVHLLAERGWFVSYVEIDQVGDVFLSLVGGGELKVNTEDPPLTIVENLLIVLAAPEFEHIEPGNFQYIDLRYGNKVFVNEEFPLEEVAPEIASSTLLEQI